MALIDYNPPQEPWLDLVYCDDYIAVVNKPSGLLSVPGNQPQYYDSAMSRVKEKYGFVNRHIALTWPPAGFCCLR